MWEGGLEGGGPGGEFAEGAAAKNPDCAWRPGIAEEVGEGSGDGAVPGEEADAKGEGSKGSERGGGGDEVLTGEDGGGKGRELVADANEAYRFGLNLD